MRTAVKCTNGNCVPLEETPTSILRSSSKSIVPEEILDINGDSIEIE